MINRALIRGTNAHILDTCLVKMESVLKVASFLNQATDLRNKSLDRISHPTFMRTVSQRHNKIIPVCNPAREEIPIACYRDTEAMRSTFQTDARFPVGFAA